MGSLEPQQEFSIATPAKNEYSEEGLRPYFSPIENRIVAIEKRTPDPTQDQVINNYQESLSELAESANHLRDEDVLSVDASLVVPTPVRTDNIYKFLEEIKSNSLTKKTPYQLILEFPPDIHDRPNSERVRIRKSLDDFPHEVAVPLAGRSSLSIRHNPETIGDIFVFECKAGQSLIGLTPEATQNLRDSKKRIIARDVKIEEQVEQLRDFNCLFASGPYFWNDARQSDDPFFTKEELMNPQRTNSLNDVFSPNDQDDYKISGCELSAVMFLYDTESAVEKISWPFHNQAIKYIQTESEEEIYDCLPRLDKPFLFMEVSSKNLDERLALYREIEESYPEINCLLYSRDISTERLQNLFKVSSDQILYWPLSTKASLEKLRTLHSPTPQSALGRIKKRFEDLSERLSMQPRTLLGLVALLIFALTLGYGLGPSIDSFNRTTSAVVKEVETLQSQLSRIEGYLKRDEARELENQ